MAVSHSRKARRFTLQNLMQQLRFKAILYIVILIVALQEKILCMCVLTISGNVQLHQLHEIGHIRGESLDLIVTKAKLPEVQ